MRVFQSLEEARGLGPVALCLGNFDGVHLGHRALFAKAASQGRPAALTFQPHPGKVLQPELAPKLITPLARKLELLAECGLEATIIQPFTRDYAQTPAERFERQLLDEVGARQLVVGYDFTYGRARQGSIDTLRAACAARGAAVQVIAPVTVDGVVVSSTKVREYILEGRVEAAQRLLGRYFDLDGTVVPGQGRGRTLGVPTANVDTVNELRPGAGVYAVQVALKSSAGELELPWRPGAANIGVKPTFGGGAVTIEVHLLDFSGDLYRREVRVQFIERLRPERRFGSAAELAAQIHRDLETARAALARSAPAAKST